MNNLAFEIYETVDDLYNDNNELKKEREKLQMVIREVVKLLMARSNAFKTPEAHYNLMYAVGNLISQLSKEGM